MKPELQPEMENSVKPIAGQGFFCCCPIVLPLLPFFALRWAVIKITGGNVKGGEK